MAAGKIDDTGVLLLLVDEDRACVVGVIVVVLVIVMMIKMKIASTTQREQLPCKRILFSSQVRVVVEKCNRNNFIKTLTAEAMS